MIIKTRRRLWRKGDGLCDLWAGTQRLGLRLNISAVRTIPTRYQVETKF